jgi:Fe-S cluster assembly ATP-binding protein
LFLWHTKHRGQTGLFSNLLKPFFAEPGITVQSLLSVKNLKVSIEDKAILNGINLTINPGEFHVIMGPNGSGKSSLSYTLTGHPRYTITDGQITFNGEEINSLSPDKRAKQGIFLAMQHPLEIEGVTLKDFLRTAYNALYDGTDKQKRLKDFAEHLIKKLHLLGIDLSFAERSINVGFSGGEKKRAEMLQLAVLQPQLVILDEIDSGLDVDALKTVCLALNQIKAENPSMAVLLITHYARILNHLQPQFVHILQHGVITQSGGPELANHIEEYGFSAD